MKKNELMWIIKKPLVLTEKGEKLKERQNKFLFEVDPRANKIQIKEAVEKLFNVSVLRVNTLNMRGHTRRIGRLAAKRSNWKKAVVTLKEGEAIQFFEGV